MTLRFLLVVMVATIVAMKPAVLEGRPHPQLAKDYVEQFEALARTKAEIEVLRRMTSQLTSGGLSWPSVHDGTCQLDSATRREITKLLVAETDRLVQRLEAYQVESFVDPQRELRNVWREVRERRNRWDQEQVERVYVPPNKKWVVFIGSDTRWLWAAAVFAVACLAGVSWHDRRHEYRRRLNGSQARAYQLPRILGWGLGVLLVLMVTAFFAAERIQRYVLGEATLGATRSIARMAEEIHDLRERRQAAGATLAETQGEFQAALHRWSALEPDPRLRQQWERLEQQLREASVERVVLGQLSEGLGEDGQVLQRLEQLREEAGTAGVALDRLKRRVHLGIGLGLSSLTLFLGFALLFTIHRRREQIKRTCPRCLGWDTLQLDRKGKLEGLRVDLPELRCSNKLPNGRVCGFTTRDSLQGLQRLCFPTIGIPQAGKTHWLTILYKELQETKYAAQLQHSLIESSSSRLFDANVERVAVLREKLPPNQPGDLPDPLLFKFRDHDSFGRSDVLVHVFDFSGEVAVGVEAGFEKMARLRVLQSDGYLFFFDPTCGGKGQDKAIEVFRQHLERIGELKATRSLRTSVALCIGKIEMLAAKTSLPREFVRKFHRELDQIDKNHPGLSLTAIEQRSQLAEGLWKVLWPDWNIQGLIDDLFGGRHMFFPLTPVNRDLPEGVDPYDLKNRTLDPFGIVEPLVWLIEMNGYPILK